MNVKLVLNTYYATNLYTVIVRHQIVYILSVACNNTIMMMTMTMMMVVAKVTETCKWLQRYIKAYYGSLFCWSTNKDK